MFHVPTFFSGKHIVITGAASGIGHALATALLPVAGSLTLVDYHGIVA